MSKAVDAAASSTLLTVLDTVDPALHWLACSWRYPLRSTTFVQPLEGGGDTKRNLEWGGPSRLVNSGGWGWGCSSGSTGGPSNQQCNDWP